MPLFMEVSGLKVSSAVQQHWGRAKKTHQQANHSYTYTHAHTHTLNTGLRDGLVSKVLVTQS